MNMNYMKEPQNIRRKQEHFSLIGTLLLFLCTCISPLTQAFSPAPQRLHRPNASQSRFDAKKSVSQLEAIPAVAASLLAGSISGAIGIGVAYPLDTLKTKSQVMEGNSNMFQITKYIYTTEGIGGFFGGVKAMMVGQALIKAVAFCANDWGIQFLLQQQTDLNENTIFLTAACFSGFVTSFVTAPAERIKIIMQANGKELYENDWDCFTSILRDDGLATFFTRGLGTTLLRDTPSYGLYFCVYHILMNTDLAAQLGTIVAPISFGAFSGCLSWVPIYPIDVVKTLVQNAKPGEEMSATELALGLWKTQGPGAFFDGLTPKMLRAGVCNSINFYLYDVLMEKMTSS